MHEDFEKYLKNDRPTTAPFVPVIAVVEYNDLTTPTDVNNFGVKYIRKNLLPSIVFNYRV